MWESNPPKKLRTSHNGFEDREAHQTPSCSQRIMFNKDKKPRFSPVGIIPYVRQRIYKDLGFSLYFILYQCANGTVSIFVRRQIDRHIVHINDRKSVETGRFRGEDHIIVHGALAGHLFQEHDL